MIELIKKRNIVFTHYTLSFRAKLRAVKLQSYWKKICEDEKRSRQRNSQLLRDLDRIEANMAGLEARREKIKHMKVSLVCVQTTGKRKESIQC